jgi:hypothetical protein
MSEEKIEAIVRWLRSMPWWGDVFEYLLRATE